MWTCNMLAQQQQGFMYSSAANTRMQTAPVCYLLVSNAGQITVCSEINLSSSYTRLLIERWCCLLSRRPPKLPVRCSIGMSCCCEQTPPDCRTTLPKAGSRTPCLTTHQASQGCPGKRDVCATAFCVPFLCAAEWPRGPKGPSKRLLCVANAGQHAMHTARQQLPPEDLLYL